MIFFLLFSLSFRPNFFFFFFSLTCQKALLPSDLWVMGSDWLYQLSAPGPTCFQKCTFAGWINDVEEDSRYSGPSHCCAGYPWLPSHPSSGARSMFWSSAQGFIANGARDKGSPQKIILPPTPYNVNLETRDELYVCSLKISWYSWKRDTLFNMGAKHLLHIFVVLNDNVSKSPKLVPK